MPLLPIKGAWELTHVPQIRREELVVALPPVKGDIGAHPMSPQIRREWLIVAPPSNLLPLLRGHRSSSHAPPIKKN